MAQAQYANIRPGCTLLNVGDTIVRGQTFKQVQPLLAESKRPVRLLWSERITCHFGLDTKDSGKPLGLKFGEKQAGDKFPLVTCVQENSHCTGQTGVQGCVLYRIETEITTRLASVIDFKTYGILSQKRPLTLVFKAAPRNKVGHELALLGPRIEEGTPPESPAAASPRSSYHLLAAHEPEPESEPEFEPELEP